MVMGSLLWMEEDGPDLAGRGAGDADGGKRRGQLQQGSSLHGSLAVQAVDRPTNALAYFRYYMVS